MSYIIFMYDVHDDSRRNRLARRLQALGYTRIQYSAFLARGPWSLGKEAYYSALRIVEETDRIFVVRVPARFLEEALTQGVSLASAGVLVV